MSEAGGQLQSVQVHSDTKADNAGATTNSLLTQLLQSNERLHESMVQQERIARFMAGLHEVNAHASVHVAQQMDNTFVAHDASAWMTRPPVRSTDETPPPVPTTDEGALVPREGVTHSTPALPWSDYSHIDFTSNFDAKEIEKVEKAERRKTKRTNAPTTGVSHKLICICHEHCTT